MASDSRSPATAANALNADRWPQLKALFDSAAPLNPSERNAFLDNCCASDGELRRELESLLQAYDETGDFLEQPIQSIKAFAGAAPAGCESEQPRVGSRIGAYRLEKEVGRGGMGAVFLATRADSEFVKRVAIKLIRGGKESEFAIRRFRHERQILARLENAFVARLIDGGTTDSGLPYFVMEYVEGKPITEYCDAHSLNTRDRLELFLNVCSAVRYAHERNIVHRDLKPGNILVKEDGTPKLLDFGIAKILGAEMQAGANDATLAGFRLLTPAYASPEQMRGDPATVRSDVYSLGVVLYELLCGERPSLNTFQRAASSPDTTQEAHLSPQLRAIVFCAIRWGPDERYPSVEAFMADLRRYLEGVPARAKSDPALEAAAAPERISLAILPFRVLGAEGGSNAFLASGIADVLITRLSRLDRFSVRPTSAVLKYAHGSDTARAAKELRVKYVLEGAIHTFEECVRVSVQLVFAEAGIAVWSAQFDEQSKELIKLEDSIAEQVAYALIPHLTGEEREQVAKSGTASGQAHEAYLRGRWHWNRSAGDPAELAQALVCFTQAIAHDASYARAHAGLADYYLRLGLWGGLPPSESFAAAIQSAGAAVRLDPALGEAHASLAFALWAHDRDYAGAEKHFNLAIIRNPDYASAHHWFGLLNSARNRPELAIANLERARKVDPNSPIIAAALGFVYYNARQFPIAVQLLLEAARELRNSPVIQEMLAWCYLGNEDAAKAVETARRAVELSGRGTSALAALACAEAAAGNIDAAFLLRDEIERAARERYVSGYDRATAFLSCGDVENSIRSLEQAFADRDWWVCWIRVDPRWDRVRNEPRFARFVSETQPERTLEWPVAADPVKRRAGRWPILALPACLLVFVAAWFLAAHNKPPVMPFATLKVTKLTSNGIASRAVISANGRYVAYTQMDRGNTGLFLRDRTTSRTIELATAMTGLVTGLAFTHNDAALAFVSYPENQPSSRSLYTVPVSGGTPRQILDTFPGPVSLSADGSRAAWFRSNRPADTDELWITDVATNSARMLASYRYPSRFAWGCPPAWSPDGKLIAYAAEGRDAKGFLMRLFVVDLKTGRTRLAPSPRWQKVQRIAWARDQSALAAVGQEQESSFQQIWYIRYPNGEARRIGNDLDEYFDASLTAGTTGLVSVQVQTLSNIYVLNPKDISHPVQITPGSGRYFDLSWMPDGRIVYASDATGSADIWVMNADGRGQRQITFGNGRNYAPVASPDGRTVVFHSNRGGNWHIWRTEVDGSNPTQLSISWRDGNWPRFTRDGNSVVFHQIESKGAYNIWKVPVSGGPEVEMTKALTMRPAVSAKDGKIAAWYSETLENPHWKIAIFAPEGGEPLRVFNPTRAAKPDTTLRWTPSGDAITFEDWSNGVSNIWLQPVNGATPRPLTSFTSGDIYSFDWSKDGTLVYSRGLTTADVVLIQDVPMKDTRLKGGAARR